MAKDFKANQVRTSKIIISGSETGKPALLVYSASDATNFAGGYQTDMLTNVGSDVFLFVSGNNNSVISNNRSKVTLFGGDVVVSGTFYAEKLVAEVNTTVNSDHHISGGIYLTEKGSDPEALTDQVALYSKDVGGSSKLFYRSTDKIVELGAQATGTFHVPQPSEFVTTASVSIAGSSQGFSYTADSVGSDVRFHVSGTSAFVGPVKISGSLNQALNGVASEYGTATGKQTLASGDFANAQGLLTTGSGQWSHSEGFKTTASGLYSHAEGHTTVASAGSAHSEGTFTLASGESSHAEGYGSLASGFYAHTEGAFTTASATYSHAEGGNTLASGNSSHAEGSYSTASNTGAHSEGTLTIASGQSSHAEGYSSLASGIYAHAEGYYSTASGTSAHAEGAYTTASNTGAHSEGFRTNANGTYSHTEGRQTEASGLSAHAEGHGTLANGDYAHAAGLFTTASGEGARSAGELSVAAGKGSHAEGYASNVVSAWAHAEGYYTRAAQTYSHAEGYFATASGIGSHAEGQYTTAQGHYSHAEGTYTKTTAAAHAEGFGTLASNAYAHAEGYYATASGQYSHAEGKSTLANGAGSHAEGGDTNASGIQAHSEGYFTKAQGHRSHAEGNYATSSGQYAHAEGGNTLASGEGSHAEGLYSVAQGSYSHAEGNYSLASGNSSHAEGYFSTASFVYAHAEGFYTQAKALASHAEGHYTTASGNYSHSQGSRTVAVGEYSHAGGIEVLASGSGQYAIGKYNETENTTSLFVVGAGGHSEDRTDAFLVNSSSAGYSVHVGTGSNTKLIVDESGSVGVGVENPLGKMHIKSGDSGQPAPSGFADDLIIEGSESTGISILTPNNQVGRIYFGDNDNEQRGYILYDHNLDVMKFSVANGNRVIIDQGGLSGSLTNLVDGTSYIKAGTNVTVASESNGSLTISSTNVGGTIGAAEDGSYTDGLFTSFTSATTIGTAIDRINEVLKYLAPSPARNVNDINSDQTGTDARLSFGELSSNNPSGYATGSAHTGSNTLTGINLNSEFNVTTGSGGDLRLSVFNSPTTISGFINSKELQSDYNGGSVVNHVADAFGDAERGTLSLEVNGSTVVSIELTGSAVGNGVPGSGTATHLGTGDHSSTGFIQLSQTGSAKTQSGVDFPVFQHRTGKYTIAATSQRKGYNYAKVKHVVGSTTHTTNFVEWVYDQDGTNASTPISANDAGFVIDPLAGGTNRFDMSGVRYSVTGSGEYRVRVENFYKHVYATNPISNSITNSSIASTTPSTVPTIGVGEDHTKALHVTSSFNTTTSTMLGTTVAGDISVAHPTKTGLSFGGAVTSGRFLMYSGSVTSTDTSETFDHEAYRLQSGSFDAQTDVTGGSYDWNSTVHMTASNGGHSDGMQFYNGVLKSPTQTLNNGDFRSVSDGGSYFGDGFIYDEQPNYASETGLRTFYRKIKNTTGSPIRDFKIQFNAGNTTIPTIVSQGTSLDTQKMKVFARLPGEAGSEWLDLGTEFRYHTSSNRSGGRANTTLNTGGSPINYFTFGTGSVANNDFFVVKIEADASLTRDIGGITFTLPGIGGTTSHAPNASTLNSTNGTGVDGKLSFGSSKPISSYNNVTGTSPSFEGAVDINEAFNVTGNRYGIFNSTTDLVGVINHDVNSAGNSYPNDAFGGGNAHLGSLKLEVNGSIVHTTDLTNLNLEGTTNGSNSGFTNLSIATNATGSNGIVADYTKFWRTGNYIIKGSDFVDGRNFARVIHSVTGTDYVTNYVEWVNDSDGSALSITNAEFTPFGESSELYFQSGVKYFTVPTGSFKAQASHAYSNVFSGDADGISITHVSNLNAGSFPLTQVTGSGITNGHATSNQMALPDLDTGVSSPEQLPIFITSSIKFSQTTSLPGGAVSGFAGTNYGGAAQLDVKHPLNGTQTSGNIHVGGNSSKKFLVFSGTMGDGNLYTSERFGREDFRLISGSYDAQGDIGFASRWDSSKDMNDSANVGYYDGLIVYNGNLASPTDARLPGSGDFRSVFDTGTSDIISPLGNVNYETLPAASSSHRTYFRYFENNTTNNVLRIGVTLFGDATIVGKSGALSGSLGSNNNIYLEGKIPGKTGWMDLGRDTLGSGNTSDGDGGRVTGDVTVDSSGALTTFTFNGQTLDGTGTGPDKVVLKITAHKDWSGNISRLDVNHSV